MADDDVDPELVALLRQTLVSPSQPHQHAQSQTHHPTLKVLPSAEFITKHALDVALDAQGTKSAAENIYMSMREKNYSMSKWSSHELHPVPPPYRSNPTNPEDTKNDDDDEKKVQKEREQETENEKEIEKIVNFIFTTDLLNFCFWSSEDDPQKQFGIEYRGKKWTGYWSLVASLRRALEEDDIPITTPSFWIDLGNCPDEKIRHVFRSCTDEEMPMLQQRIDCLREAGRVLCNEFNSSFINCIQAADHSAVKLVNLLVEHFACFRDIFVFPPPPPPISTDDDDQPGPPPTDETNDNNSSNGPGSDIQRLPQEKKHQNKSYDADDGITRREIHFLKRAQILVADLWACFEGTGPGRFDDVDEITMFADYRIPQMLHRMGCLLYSPALESHINRGKMLESGGRWEMELRGCSIWSIELIRRIIIRLHRKPTSTSTNTNISTTTPSNPDTTSMDEPQKMNEGKEEKEFKINAILIDFFLYDTLKEMLAGSTSDNGNGTGRSSEEVDEQGLSSQGQRERNRERERERERDKVVMMRHHRTRSIWY